MLKARIQSEAVCHNIDLFQKTLQGSSQNTYQAFVNCQTGSLRFSRSHFLNKSEWKEIRIHLDPSHHQVEVFDIEEKAFDLSSFDPLAYRVMAETFFVLQYILQKLSDFKELPVMKLESASSKSLHRDPVHRAWHPIDRPKAETLLSGKEIGTYIFRKDEFAHNLEKELSHSLKAPIKCVTLTYLDEQAAIKDKTIVKYKNQWLFYENQASLSGESFEDITYLLGSSQDIFTSPLEY